MPPAAPPPLSPRARLRWDLVRRIVAEIAPASVLEIGCGQGSMGARLAEMTQTYRAVEPDEASCALAAERIGARGGEVVRGDHTAVPDAWTTGGGSDLVCAFEVLEHIDDDAAALADWVGLARPGGHVLLSVPAWPDRFGASDEKVGHFRRYTPDGLAQVMADAGLSAPFTQMYGWPLGYALELVSNRLDARALAGGSVPTDVASRTATSGRNRQTSSRLVGTALAVGTAPFALAQRLVPRRGPALVGLGRRPGRNGP
ncbi:MAG: class I SAM-dependent methyltransferase [Mycobacteriaceae bacterium]